MRNSTTAITIPPQSICKSFKYPIYEALKFVHFKFDHLFIPFKLGGDVNELKYQYDKAMCVCDHIGLILYFQFTDEKQAKQEASHFMYDISSMQFDLPIFLSIGTASDIVDNSKLEQFTNINIATIIRSFCEVVESYSSYKMGLKVNQYWYDRLDFAQLYPYDIWFCQTIVDVDFELDYVPNVDFSLYHYCEYDAPEFLDYGIPPNRIEITKVYKDYFARAEKRGWHIDTSLHNEKSYRYAFNVGQPYISNTWLNQNGSWFYFDQCGYMVSDIQYRHNDIWYTIGPNGKLSADTRMVEKTYDMSVENAAFKYPGLLEGLI